MAGLDFLNRDAIQSIAPACPLRLTPIGSEIRRPAAVIGKNTVHSMQSGLYYGYVGLIDGLIRRLREELGEAAKVIATGGVAGSFAEDYDGFDSVDADLTLEGLRLIYERNR